MNIETYMKTLALGNRLLKEYGLSEKGWTFAISKSKRRVGVCKFDEQRIEVSEHYIDNGLHVIEDTIRHEIAHALIGPGHGHDYVWRRKAIEVGATPERLAAPEVKTTAKPNYVIKCPACGWSVTRYRMRERNFGSRCPACRTEVKIYRVVK